MERLMQERLNALNLRMADHLRVVRCMRRATVALLFGEGSHSLFSAGNCPMGTHVCTGITGGCGCAHAEQQLVMQALALPTLIQPGKDLELWSWLSPCSSCANAIAIAKLIDLNVTRVVYVEELEHDQLGKRTLLECGIDVVKADR
jgi:deoxycytidylate deaminase